MSNFEVVEHKSASYAPRTWHNASVADLTAAFAVDFTTAGERLTKKAAGEKYIHLDLSMEAMEAMEATRSLYKACKKHNVRTLNIAGNGIYTLYSKGMDQEDANVYLYTVLSLVHKHHPIEKIVSGGQTGIDLAGGVVAKYLGIDCTMTLPKGFKMRFENGVDVDMMEAKYVVKLVDDWVQRLKEEVE